MCIVCCKFVFAILQKYNVNMLWLFSQKFDMFVELKYCCIVQRCPSIRGSPNHKMVYVLVPAAVFQYLQLNVVMYYLIQSD